MKTFLIGAAFVMISAAAHAETYHVNGVTIDVPTHCGSSSCVSVDAPEYGYRHDGTHAKARTDAHADRKAIKTAAVAKKADKLDTSATPAAEAHANDTHAEAAPAPAVNATPATTPDVSAAPATDAATK